MTTASTLGLAIVGCGTIGATHARAIASTPGARLVAVIDGIPETAKSFADHVAAESGCEPPAVFADIASLPTEVQVVAICTPSGNHVDLAESALTAGKHVVLEKPLDVSMERGRRLSQLAGRAAAHGLSVTVISQHRHDPAAMVVADAAHSGGFGRITSAVASVPWRRTQEYYDSGSWRGTWEFDGGGAVMNQGVHTVDLLLWFLGTPVEVYAQTALLAHERIEVEDVAVATVRFESGALAVLHATTAANTDQPVRVAVYGFEGAGIVENDQLGLFSLDGDPGDRSLGAVPPGHRLGDPKPADHFTQGHARQYGDIVDAITTGRRPTVGVPEALLALAVVRAMYISATTGAPVQVADVLDGSISDDIVKTGGAG
jgi:predicted dehydrogenase